MLLDEIDKVAQPGFNSNAQGKNHDDANCGGGCCSQKLLVLVLVTLSWSL